VAYGRPKADLRHIDYDKFPHGLRPVVDYAHQRDLTVGLFMSAGFVRSGQGNGGEWLALRGLIDQHPDWLLPLVKGSAIDTYMLDYSRDDVRDYVRSIVDDFSTTYGVDGIKLDGLADPEGELTELRDRRGLLNPPYLPATDILRIISDRFLSQRPDGYIESGWINPQFAKPYADTFWGGDNWPAFDREYPFGGLLQHIDYALFQRVALGQRPKLATVFGDPNGQDVRQWFEAGLALGVQVTAGFDLTALTPDSLSALRCLLVHYDAFEADVVTSARMQPNVFATTSDHITYLGILNRSRDARQFGDEIGELNVLAPGLSAFDVERRVWIPALAIPSVSVAGRSFRLFIIPHQPRVVWTNASPSYEDGGDDGLRLTLIGPAGLGGFAQIWAPGVQSVQIDGVPLRADTRPGPGRYGFDPATGVVSVEFSMDQPPQGGAREIALRW
jgi:hypothetical protein